MALLVNELTALHLEEEFYAEMWDRDRQAKMKREELDTALQHERNTEMMRTLNIQLASLEEQRQEATRLKEQEAELCREEARLRKLEDERRIQEKRDEQQETRRMLAASLRMKMKKRAREVTGSVYQSSVVVWFQTTNLLVLTGI